MNSSVSMQVQMMNEQKKAKEESEKKEMEIKTLSQTIETLRSKLGAKN